MSVNLTSISAQSQISRKRKTVSEDTMSISSEDGARVPSMEPEQKKKKRLSANDSQRVPESPEVSDESEHIPPRSEMSVARMKEILKTCRGLKGSGKTSEELQRNLESIRKEKSASEYSESMESGEYIVDIILSVSRPPRSIKDKVFLVKWQKFNVTGCTFESIEDLRMCEAELLEFIAYWNSTEIVAEKINGERQQLPLLSTVFGDKWLNLDDYEKEKEVVGKIGGWKWKEIEEKWNDTIYAADPSAKFLRLDCFHANKATTSAKKLEFIYENEFSEKAAAKEKKDRKKSKIDGCKCRCNRICKKCVKVVGLEGVRLEANKAVDFDKERKSFCTLICGKKSRCPPNSLCRRRSQRSSQMLIAFQPRVNGFGAFALQDIPKGEIVTEYVGKVFTMDEVPAKANTSYQFDLANAYIIDARIKGNESRFLNHSCDPNCALLSAFEDNVHSFPRLYFFVRKDIKAGEELTIDYHPNVSVEEAESKLGEYTKCSCGASRCRGYV